MKKLHNIVLPIFLSLLIYSCAEQKSINNNNDNNSNSEIIDQNQDQNTDQDQNQEQAPAPAYISSSYLEDSYILSDTPKIGQVTFKPESRITGSSYLWEIEGITISNNTEREITANFTEAGEYIVTLNVDGEAYQSKIIIPDEIDYEIDLGQSSTIISDISGKKLYVYGDNTYGQLCIEKDINLLQSPRILLKGKEISSVALGSNHTLFTDNSNIYTCGNNTYGQLGDGSTNERETEGFSAISLDFVVTNYGFKRIFVSAGGDMSVAGLEYWPNQFKRTAYMAVYNWGYNELVTDNNAQITPNNLVYGVGSRDEPLFATGNNFSVIRATESLNVFSVGVNDKWQLGRIANYTTDYDLDNNPDLEKNWNLNITDMVSRYVYTPYGEEDDDNVWGIDISYLQNNYYARLATGDDFAMVVKREVQGVDGWASGYVYNLYIWGNNENNMLGFSSNNEPVRRATALFNAYSTSPAETDINKVTPIQDEIIEIAAGAKSGFAISSSGTLYGWGDDTYSQLTSRKVENSTNNLVYEISKPAGVTAGYQNIWAGGNRVIALAGDNNLYTWGDNTRGILGVGSDEDVVGTPQKLFFSLESITQ